ncbi:MAG: helix-turn-helix domain-containing protein [Flavobacteriaceae bacterium]|jgi:transcriptional regulator with XRE-family HTH domain|nr:helix-turn-helix domain-containing protein [Flavobacteriaceae bacterium]
MDNFVNRLAFLLEHFEFSASTFADKIGVQRSSLSHILSGRNKPSLDFILKIKECFPELNFDWLLQGKGSFSDGELTLSNESKNKDVAANFSTVGHTPNTPLPDTSIDLFSQQTIPHQTPDQTVHVSPTDPALFLNDNNLERIILFYKDGTFKQYMSR